MTSESPHQFDMKLRPPVSRPGLVQRARILEKLQEGSDTPVISIVAPPGYGKTTVMAQFHDSLERPSAWLTIDESDSDPVSLFRTLAEALNSVGLLDGPYQTHRLRSGDALTTGIGLLSRAIDPSLGGILIVDQVDHLRTQAALDVVGAVMSRLSANLQVVVAARTGEGLPLAALRSRAELLELGASELAMNPEEATRVFEAAEVSPDKHIDVVMDRTEGWPAGVYLTAMAIKAGSPGLDVGGDDIFLADYLRDELLGRVPEEVMDFLLRTSILTRMTGPLCDHVLGRRDSAQVLADLVRANLLIIPMDRTKTWYRYHSLLRDYLQSELERSHPAKVAGLHLLAGEWLETNGFTERAADHYMAAGDLDRFGDLVTRSARVVYSVGKVETVLGWMNVLEDGKILDNYPDLAAIGSFARALEGDAGGSERLAVHVFTTEQGSRREDDALGPFALMLRSYQAERGARQALDDARSARGVIESQEIQWLHAVMGAEALATQALDGLEAAEPIWTDALWRAEGLGASPFISEALAQRALTAIGRNEWAVAEGYVAQSLDLIAEGGLERYITSALTYTLAARVAARRGDVEHAQGHLAGAAQVRPRLSVALPFLAVQNLHEMARAYLEAADVAGARRVFRDAADIIVLRPRLGTFVADHDDLKAMLSALPAGSVGASSLTKAELRLLPLLVTHLTYPDIGERLYVSRHTVKTQAMSIYRKLGVSSRTEAVAKAREVGLLSV